MQGFPGWSPGVLMLAYVFTFALESYQCLCHLHPDVICLWLVPTSTSASYPYPNSEPYWMGFTLPHAAPDVRNHICEAVSH